MEPIYIPQLKKAPEQTEVITIEESVPGLETLTPVRGKIRVTHKGTYLDVAVMAETIMTLTCNRCLQQYNHRLVLNTSELIWLDEAANQLDDGPLEREVLVLDFLEILPPDGYFNASDWLYQQMCLAIPQRQLCDSQCPGISVKSEPSLSEPLTDRRWATLEALKKQFPS